MNTNLAKANSTATLVSVTEKDGVYQIAASYQAQNINMWATKECNLLFTSSYNLKGETIPTTVASPKPTSSPTPFLNR